MTVGFEMPREIEQQIRTGGVNLDRDAKEVYLMEQYRQAKITHRQLEEALDLNFCETEQRLKPLYVSTDGTAGPYIMVPVSQLAELRELLGKNQIRYSVEEEAVSLNGAPEIAVVDLGRGADGAGVEAILKGAH